MTTSFHDRLVIKWLVETNFHHINCQMFKICNKFRCVQTWAWFMVRTICHNKVLKKPQFSCVWIILKVDVQYLLQSVFGKWSSLCLQVNGMMSTAPVGEGLSVRRGRVQPPQTLSPPKWQGTAPGDTRRTDSAISATGCSPPPCHGPMPPSSVWGRAGRSTIWPASTVNWTTVTIKSVNHYSLCTK